MSQRILYIQHAGALGGSCMSLLYLIQGLDRSQYEPVVACIHPAEAVLNLYKQHGIETLYWEGITPFEHTTLGWTRLYDPLALPKQLRQILLWRKSARATQALIEAVKPDLVHLNSLVLAPSALGVKHSGRPLVWHVREPVHAGHIGLRRTFLKYYFQRYADQAIFISEYDRHQLTDSKSGIVIHNFVNFADFDKNLSGNAIRDEFRMTSDDRIILYLGGQSIVKGIFPLLKALPLLREKIPQVHLLIGSGAYHPSGRRLSRIARRLLPMLGYGTVAQRVNQLITDNDLQDNVHLLPFRQDIPALLAACDVLVFPSIKPHFARPVIEAGAMAKPVVASRIGGVEELVQDKITGLLVPPNNPEALAAALAELLDDPQAARHMGEQGYQHARARFDFQNNVQATIRVYEQLS